MPEVGFEPTIPVFERAKTVQALDRAVTVIGIICTKRIKLMHNAKLKSVHMFHLQSYSTDIQIGY
jgi:hypothetical protein